MSVTPGMNPRISCDPAPRPLPHSKRFSVRWSSMATFSATFTGWLTWASGLKIPEPRWIRSVACARYPRNTSLAERCEYSSRKWCSDAQAYLKPDRSAWMTYSVSSISALCSASGSVSARLPTYPCTKSPNSKEVHRPQSVSDTPVSDTPSDFLICRRLWHRAHTPSIADGRSDLPSDDGDPGEPPAVDHERLPGDVRGVGGGQEERERRHLLRPPDPAQRDDLAVEPVEPPGGLLAVRRRVQDGRVGHRGVHGTRAHGVDPDTARCQLQRGDPGEPEDRVLGGRVGTHPRHPGHPGVGGGVDDRAAVGQDRRHGPDAEEAADLVDVHDLHELVEGGVEKGVEAQDAGVVDEPVDPAVLLDDGLYRPPPVGLLTHIQVDVQRPDLLGERLALLVQHIAHDDLGALLPEQPGLLLALPARRAGDEDDTSVQLAHAVTPQT